MPESIVSIEEELRRRVRSQSYTDLPEVAVSYREAVEASIRSLAPGDRRISEIAARAGEVLQEAIAQVRCDRDLLASQLAQLPKLKSFLETPSDPCPRVRFDG